MKSRILIALFALLWAGSSFAQSPKYIIDSLKIQLNSVETNKEKVGIYSELTWYWAMVNLDSALVNGKAGLSLAEKQGDAKAIAQANSDLANAYNNRGDFALAKEGYKKALAIRTDLADSAGMAGSKSNLASIHQRLFQTDSAMMYYMQALDYYKRTGNDRYINFVKNNIAVLHEDLNDYDRALAMYEDVAVYREENNMTQELAMLYNNIGNIYKKTKRFEKGEDYFHKALDKAFEAGDSIVVSVTYLNLAALYNASNLPDRAIEAAQKGIKIAEKVNSTYDQGMMQYALANAYSKKKEYQLSKKLYLQGIETLQGINAMEEVVSMQLRLAPVYAALNMPDSAQYYTDLYIEYRNELTESQVTELTKELETKYETERKDREIVEQQLSIRNKNFQLYGSLFLALALGIVGYLLYNQQKLKNHQLQQEAELKSALAQLETQNKLQEQRLLISRDLHDNIGAQLTFIISAIENLKYFDPIKEQLTQRYDTIANFTKQTITELRDTIWAMNSGQVTWESLSGRIQDYLMKARQSAPQTEFDLMLSERLDLNSTLNSADSIQILRVVQEAVQNAVKYAEASAVKVQVKSSAAASTVSVLDDGKGFTESEIKPGNGLYNMRKRAEELGGEVRIQSGPGTGTEVVLSWPS